MEECFLDALSKTSRWLKNTIMANLKGFGSFLKSMILVLMGIIIIMEISRNYTSIQAQETDMVVQIGTFLVTLLGGCYALVKYKNHLQEEKRKVLCEYNQRYSTDKNVEAVIEWMLKVAITNETDGDIIGVNNYSNEVSPGIHKKEMFLRFFEELNLRIESEDLRPEEVYRLFSYYALKFDQFWGFRLDIEDYKNDLEVLSMNESDRSIFKDNWADFHSFIRKMKTEENKQHSC